MLKIVIDYPDKAEEKEIMKRVGFDTPEAVRPVLTPEEEEAIVAFLKTLSDGFIP